MKDDLKINNYLNISIVNPSINDRNLDILFLPKYKVIDLTNIGNRFYTNQILNVLVGTSYNCYPSHSPFRSPSYAGSCDSGNSNMYAIKYFHVHLLLDDCTFGNPCELASGP